MNNFASKNKYAKIGTLTVGTSNVFTPAIDTTGFEKLMFAFTASTFAGTPNAADYVKVVKFQGSNTGVFGGEEIDIAGVYDFEKSNAALDTDGLSQLSVANNTAIKKTTLASYAMKYQYIRACFISSDAANTVLYVFELTDSKSIPVNQ